MNKILISLAAITITVLAIGAGSYKIGQVRAQEETSNFSPMIQGIVDRFGLNNDEVEEVITEQRGLMQQKRQGAMDDRLDELVTEGKLTEDQKNALLEKREEHRAEGFQGMQEHHEEMEQWMEENGIDAEEVCLGGRMSKEKGEFGGMHRGMMWSE